MLAKRPNFKPDLGAREQSRLSFPSWLCCASNLSDLFISLSELGLWWRDPPSRTTRLTDSRQKEWGQLLQRGK